MADTIINVRGIARYPWLNKPDTKFEAAGVYKVDLEIDADTAEPLIRQFTDMRAAAMKEAQKALKGKKAKEADLPISPKLDEDGNETGAFVLKAKMKASGTSKKTGKQWTRAVPIFDAKGKPANPQIYGGSEIILGVKVQAWSNPKGECSVTCYLEGVQVIKLAAGSGGASASALGFSAVEGGYVEQDPDADTETNGEGEGEGGDYDFE
jgi:hypothetical protein